MIDKNPEKIKKMFDEISSNYDKINNILSFFTHKFVKKRAILALKIPPHSRVLDLCCGSGDLGRIIKDIDSTIEVVGIDFSSGMLNIAKRNKDINYLLEDALNMSFLDGSFDFVAAGFGLRNISDIDKVTAEIYRVLKPEGKFLHLDFNSKSPIGALYDKIVLKLIGLFYKNTSAFKYLIDSKNSFLNPKELIKKFLEKGFKSAKEKKIFNIISYQILEK